MRLLLLFLLCVLLTACDGNTRDRRAARGGDYVSAPDHLYFQNIRSRDYRAVTPEQGIVAYHHDDLGADAELVLVEYWLEDRAELQLDGQSLARDQVTALRQAVATGKSVAFSEDKARAAALEVVDDYLRLTGG
ncbi:hypothetical protein [Neolewinella sp.]|uniref:hypothetical protein n=1 Tax=Neolewinella sp. TaxID=2993543 RepID=UPI003B52D283